MYCEIKGMLKMRDQLHSFQMYDSVMAVMIRFSPNGTRRVQGRVTPNRIETTRDLSEIASDNLTYQLLDYITTSTCATVPSYILSYAAIYGYTAIHYNRT
jgi:hypothetical protein